MQFWEQIIHTALLGTDKKAAVEGLPPALEQAVAQLNSTADKEERFLQTAALAFNYRQSGVMPLHKEGVTLAPAPPEEKPYCSPLAMQTLKDILDEESFSLLRFWLHHCNGKQRIVTPVLLPQLLSMGVPYKKLQPAIAACCGKRGEWLSRFNDAWNFSTNITDEELWSTGTLEQRKWVLHQMRERQRAQAREWLQQTWAQEDAATKLELLGALSTSLAEEDIPFLESLATEKGKKVKEAALELLKKIPRSSIVQQYQALLQQMVGRHHIKLPENIDPNIFKTGIDKLSNTKELTDDEYIAAQLTRFVPPSFWEGHFNQSPEKIVKDLLPKKLIPSLVIAIVQFNDHRWANEMIRHNNEFYIDLIPFLPVAQQEQYSIQYIGQYAELIIDLALKRSDEWGLALTRVVLQHTAANPYQYSKAFYNQHIERIPAAIAGELDKLVSPAANPYGNWHNTASYISRLLQLKTQIIKSFNH